MTPPFNRKRYERLVRCGSRRIKTFVRRLKQQGKTEAEIVRAARYHRLVLRHVINPKDVKSRHVLDYQYWGFARTE